MGVNRARCPRIGYLRRPTHHHGGAETLVRWTTIPDPTRQGYLSGRICQTISVNTGKGRFPRADRLGAVNQDTC